MLYNVEGIFGWQQKQKQRTQDSLLSLPLPHITELQTALLECIFSGVKIF